MTQTNPEAITAAAKRMVFVQGMDWAELDGGDIGYWESLASEALAHQTPPATQPIATVGAIARIIEPAVPWDEKAPLYGVADFETRRDAALGKARQIATLHTPPPVATATVVDAAENLLIAIGMGWDLGGCVERLQDALRATPTPPAGDQ